MRWYWQVLWLLATPLVGFVVLAGLAWSLPPIPASLPKTQWTAGKDPAPKFFRYLAYPRTDRVAIYLDKNKTPAGFLERALSNSEEERQAGGLVTFNQPDGPRWVEWSDLQFDPPAERATALEQTWKAVYGGQGPGQVADVQSVPTDKGARLTLTIGDAEQTFQFVYRVDNGQPVAEEWRWKSRRDAYVSPAAVDRFMIEAGSVVAASVLWLFLGGRMALRAKRRKALAASSS